MSWRESDFERVRFAEGQRLEAHDLQSSLDYDNRLAALHTRGLHDTWGIVEGLVVTLDVDATSGHRVKVSRGFAYDACGRLVFIQNELIVEPPPVPEGMDQAWFDLVIRYAETSGPTAGPACGHNAQGPSACARSRLEHPQWRWVCATCPGNPDPLPLARDVRLGVEIPLARIVVNRNDPPVELASIVFRRNVRRMTRPHIAGGHLGQGSVPVAGNPFAWSVVVDTTAGNFSHTPYYFVTLAEHPLTVGAVSSWLQNLDGVSSKLSLDSLAMLVGPFEWISEQQRKSFRLTVCFALSPFLVALLFPRPSTDALSRFIEMDCEPVLPTLDWLGVEPVTACYEKFRAWHIDPRNHNPRSMHYRYGVSP